jgi:hypothetical protein
MTRITQWMYQVFTLGSTFRGMKDEEITATLNLLGEDGWDVINIYPLQGSNKLRVLAKKPSTGSDRRRSTRPGY